MRKTILFLLAVMTLMLLNACGHDDEPANKPDEIQYANLVFSCWTARGNVMSYLQTVGYVELNYTQGTIQLTSDYNDYHGTRRSISTPKMELKYVSDNTYAFNDQSSINTFDGSYPNGYINMATGVVWFMFTNEHEKTVITTYLNYPAPTTTIYDLENMKGHQHTQSSYLFAPDAQGKTCVMQINNFITDLDGTVAAELIQFQGLTLTQTSQGYHITADRAESTYGGRYTITDVDIDLGGQCRDINGSFKCNGHEIRMAGGLFP